MKNSWSTKSSLTNRELECLNNISSLFNQPAQREYEKEEEVKELHMIEVAPSKKVNMERKNTAEEELDILI